MDAQVLEFSSLLVFVALPMLTVIELIVLCGFDVRHES